VRRGAVPPPATLPARPEDEPGLPFLVAAYAVLVFLGVVLALLGVFLLFAGPRTGGGSLIVPIGLVIAVVGHPAAALLGFRMTGTRAGTMAPLLGWVAVVLPLASGTAEGDVVLPGTSLSVIYLMVGVLAFAAVALTTRPVRGRVAVNRR
jgi:uncharacterized membrane protein